MLMKKLKSDILYKFQIDAVKEKKKKLMYFSNIKVQDIT